MTIFVTYFRFHVFVVSLTSQITRDTGVNFTYVLSAVFMLVDPESVKKQLSHQCLLRLLGSACEKAVGRTLMKVTPEERGTE